MVICDNCNDKTKDAQYTSLAIVTSDKDNELASYEHSCDLCYECRAMQRQTVEKALGVELVDVSPKD